MKNSSPDEDRILQEICERVKSIDIPNPHLARQKELSEKGIQGEEAELPLNEEPLAQPVPDEQDRASTDQNL